MSSGSQEKTPRRVSATLAWVLVGLLIASLLVNVITVISMQGMRQTINQMRDPVHLYFLGKLDEMETELAALENEITLIGEQKTYSGELKKLDKDLSKARDLWAKTSRVSGPRWVNLFQRAYSVQEEAEAQLKSLRSKMSY